MAIAPTSRRSWLRPRFSLRVLLLAFTAFAIGFPVWYRWPYEERRTYFDLATVSTWRREWGGGRLRQGLAQRKLDGRTYETIMYRNNSEHGPYTFDDGYGRRIVGQYFDGLRHGVWAETIDGKTTVTTWHHGKQISPPLTPPP
jgi:hypothetical protein